MEKSHLGLVTNPDKIAGKKESSYEEEHNDETLVKGEIIIAVDFDGTITTDRCSHSSDLVIREYAYEVLHMLSDIGCDLILWTCRTGDALEEAKKFLEEEDLLDLFITINDHHPAVKEMYGDDISRKIGADLYIDDRNLLVSGDTLDWRDIAFSIFGRDVFEDEE